MSIKKLLQLNVTANWGSTGKIAEGIGQAAISRGWESMIAYGRMMNPSQSRLIKVGNQKEVYLHYALNRFFDGEGLGSNAATKSFLEQIKEYAPDIIHLHNIHDHWFNYPLLFKYLATVNTPIVWTFHDCWAFTGGCAHFENIGCEKWKDSNCNGICPQHKGLLSSNRERNFRLKRDLLVPLSERITIVGVSDWITNYARRSFFKDSNFLTIHNGIDLTTFRQTNVPREKIILGVSNVWPPYKGLKDFIV
ncbi:MAG: glycosyltransferase, partial [Ruminococcus flavefaciens]|nr:glycosyltransferase [Ruminococcus flavefaciens]